MKKKGRKQLKTFFKEPLDSQSKRYQHSERKKQIQKHNKDTVLFEKIKRHIRPLFSQRKHNHSSTTSHCFFYPLLFFPSLHRKIDRL